MKHATRALLLILVGSFAALAVAIGLSMSAPNVAELPGAKPGIGLADAATPTDASDEFTAPCLPGSVLDNSEGGAGVCLPTAATLALAL